MAHPHSLSTENNGQFQTKMLNFTPPFKPKRLENHNIPALHVLIVLAYVRKYPPPPSDSELIRWFLSYTALNKLLSMFLQTHILAAPYKSECGERQLQDFKTYSFDSCLAECYTNAIMKNCGCRTLETSQIGGKSRVHHAYISCTSHVHLV